MTCEHCCCKKDSGSTALRAVITFSKSQELLSLSLFMQTV